MALPRRILSKRAVDPVEVLSHASDYLARTCDTDSYRDSASILEICLFMTDHQFQSLIYGRLPTTKAERQELERVYMKARLAYLS